MLVLSGLLLVLFCVFSIQPIWSGLWLVWSWWWNRANPHPQPARILRLPDQSPYQSQYHWEDQQRLYIGSLVDATLQRSAPAPPLSSTPIPSPDLPTIPWSKG